MRLPFKVNNIVSLRDIYQTSIKLLKRMEDRFDKDKAFKDAYHAFLREYLDLGHMSLVTEKPVDLDNCCFCLIMGFLRRVV